MQRIHQSFVTSKASSIFNTKRHLHYYRAYIRRSYTASGRVISITTFHR